MKYFVVSDVHGYFDLLMETLESCGYDKSNPNHCLISLGDLFDRGDKSYEVLQFVNSIPDKNKILVMGNHEDCLIDCIVREGFKSHDYHNKTDATVKEFYEKATGEEPSLAPQKLLNWLRTWEPYKQYQNSTVNYAVIGDKIFVHGWIPYWIREFSQLELTDYTDWYDARWDNGMRQWFYGVRIPGYTIFCGHIHTSFGNSRYHHKGVEFIDPDEDYEDSDVEVKEYFEPFIDDGIVALDACTAYSGKMNCYVFEQ